MLAVHICLLLFAIFLNVHGEEKQCSRVDFHYEYTECGSSGNRWKIRVPNETCTGDVPQPVKGKSCKFSCPAGTFLDLKTEECLECPPGSYSLGGGNRFEDFWSIPSEFSTTSEDQRAFRLFDEGEQQTEADACKNSGWKAINGYLVYLPGFCMSRLSYSVNLVRPGTVKFTYLYPDTDVMFMFSVQNAQCIAFTDELAREGSIPKQTKDGKWNTYKYNLKSGQTVLTWKGFSYSSGSYQPIFIKKIEITGIAFTQQCTPCGMGTFSSGNAKFCDFCHPGTYSQKGASKCTPCDSLSTYSDFQASSCIRRPPCTEDDYIKIYPNCKGQQKAALDYQWLQPKSCSEHEPSAVQLPKTQIENFSCSTCNSGQKFTPSGCKFCAKKMFFDIKSADCQRCPDNTVPNYGYRYNVWYTLPDNMKVSCEPTEDNSIECKNASSWVLNGHSISTVKSRIKNVYFLLTLNVAGFKNFLLRGISSERNPLGYVNFEFETKCSTPGCILYFTEKIADGQRNFFEVWGKWNGTVSKRTFSFPVTESRATEFSWLFVRGHVSDLTNGKDSSSDHAVIFSINVTNTVDGGASECLPCPQSDKNECRPCAAGHFMNSTNLQCIKCPENTFLNVSDQTTEDSQDSCALCGPNLKSFDGVDCDTDCLFNISGRHFDLSALRGNYSTRGIQIFNRDLRYYHMFNFTVCSKNLLPCFTPESTMVAQNEGSQYAGALACRISVIPGKSKLFYHTALELGDYLAGVSDKLSFPDFELPTNTVSPWRYSQLFFLYRSSSGGAGSCPQGRHTLLVFRCDPSKNRTKIDLPMTCPDGTCDGCLFQILLSSRAACPLCQQEDYTQFLGECRLGVQTVHLVPAEHCIITEKNALTVKFVKCPMLPVEVQILVGFIVFVAIVLMLLVARIWKKNKKLQYKYMKLVESSSGNDGELPAAESCALHEDDDDEEEGADRVVFKKGKKKGSSWLGIKSDHTPSIGRNRHVEHFTDNSSTKGSENRALTLDNDD